MRKLYWLILCLALVLHGHAATTYDKDKLVIGGHETFEPLNPLLSLSNQADNILDLVFNPLIKIDSSGRVSPSLAMFWTNSADQKEWVFQLFPHISFHDGKPLTAQDVVYTFQVLKKIGRLNNHSMAAQNIVSVEAQNPFQVKFVLEKPDQTFLSLVSWVFIVPSHLFNEAGQPHNPSYFFNPIGSGAFKIKSFDPRRVELEPNENYFMAISRLSGVVFEAYENERTTFSKLIHQENDYMTSQNLSYLEITKTIPYQKYNTDHNAALLLIFNQSNPELKPKEVRLALNYVLNKDAMKSRFSKSYGAPASGVVHPSSTRANRDMVPYVYDPQKALELFRQVGWQLDPTSGKLMKNGKQFEFEVMVVEGKEALTDMLQVIRSDLDEVGINMKVTLVTRQGLMEKGVQNTRSNFFLGYLGLMPIYFDWTFWASAEGEAYNLYHNPRVNELLDEARFNSDADQSLKAYREFQQLMHDDPPALYLFWQPIPVFYSARIHGLNTDPLLTFRNLNEVWIEE